MKFISNSDELTSYINLNIPVLKDIKDISIDSREISDSSLFICIKGQNFDGNDFKNEAIEKGQALLLPTEKIFQILMKRFITFQTLF